MRVLVVANPRATATTARERDVLTTPWRHRRASRSRRRPTAATPPRWPAGPCATAPTWSSPSAATAPSTRSSTGCSPTACTTDVPGAGRGAGRLDERLRPRPRPAQRPDRGHRRAARGAATGQPAPGQHGPGRRPVVRLRRRVRASTRRSWRPSRRSRRKGKRSTHTLYARAGCASSSAPTAVTRLHVELPDGTDLDDVYFAIVDQRRPVDLRRQPAAARRRRERRFDTGLGLYARRRMGTALVEPGRHASARPPSGRRRRACRCSSEDLHRVRAPADEPMPVQVDGDYLDARANATVRFRGISVVAALAVVVVTVTSGLTAGAPVGMDLADRRLRYQACSRCRCRSQEG